MYALYGIEHTTEYDKVHISFSKVKKDLKRAISEYNDINLHNAAVNSNEYSAISQDIQDTSDAIATLEGKLVSSIYSSREDIFEMNLEYERLLDKLTELNKSRVAYTAIHQEASNYSKILELTQRRGELELQLAKLSSEGDIGDVTEVYHPVSARYSVGDPFTDEHKYITIVAKKKTPVMAQFNGKVLKAGYKKKCGEYVILDCGEGITIKYTFLLNRYVKEGDIVKQYDRIGTVSSKGYIGYYIYLQGKPVDPNILLGGNSQ